MHGDGAGGPYKMQYRRNEHHGLSLIFGFNFLYLQLIDGISVFIRL